jgi:hypothetical protein
MRNEITGEHSMVERQAIGVQFYKRVERMNRERNTGAQKNPFELISHTCS